MAAHIRSIDLLPGVVLGVLFLTACSGDTGTARRGQLDSTTTGGLVRDENPSGPAPVARSGSSDVSTPRYGTLDTTTSGGLVRDENPSGPAAVPRQGTGKNVGVPRYGTLDPLTSGQEQDRTTR